MVSVNAQATSVVILGGGPGGYEAALVAAHLGARVTVVDRDGLGGAAVLTDCVPSKTLIATADYLSELEVAGELGVHLEDAEGKEVTDAVAALGEVNARVMALARAQSQDIETRVREVGVEIIRGTGRLVSSSEVLVTTDTTQQSVSADVVLVATGATPRVMDSARPDGERILTWQQIYELEELPERLIVVGSGVTGAELAQAYLGLGAEVVLVSSRDRVLPGEDPDAATVIEEVFRKRGMEVLGRSRMAAVERTDDGVIVRLEDGREITGSHALLAVGSIPQTADLGLAEVGVDLTPSGHIVVDRVSRTSVRGVCRGRLHRRPAPRVGGRHARPHRHVPRARRRRGAAEPSSRVGEHLHRPGDRHRRDLPEGGRLRAGECRRQHPAAVP